MAAKGNANKYSGEVSAHDPAWRVVIALGPSRLARAWVVLIGALALTAVFATPGEWAARSLLAGAILVASVRAARRHGWQAGAGGVRNFTVDLAGRVEIDRAGGSRVTGRLLHGSLVLPWLTIVRWSPDGAWLARAILVAPDAVAPEEFRRLRILLRWR